MPTLPIQIPSPNFTPGRKNYRPEAIVIHIMEGTLAGTDSWFSNKNSAVSAHYGIGKNGEIHQYVQEKDTAWHAGRVNAPSWNLIKPVGNGTYINPNYYTIGIEHEGNENSEWNDAMYESSSALVAEISQRWNIPIDRNHIIGHHEIYSLKTCPGFKVDLNKIIDLARRKAGYNLSFSLINQTGTVKTNVQLRIRSGSPSTTAAVVRVAPAGEVISYAGYTDDGQEVEGIKKWYKTVDGNWIWGGGITLIFFYPNTVYFNPPKQDNTSVTVKIENTLISKLQIDKIWEDMELGEAATIAILDSGIALNCQDLTDAVASGIRGGFNNAGFRMRNFVDGSNSIDDDSGHGSHCAGLIASRNLQHSVGIAKECKLYVGKISDLDNNPSIENMIKGIRWAAGLDEDSPQDIDIISMSCGSLLNLPDMKPTIIEALTKGKILVFSIGNRDPLSLPMGGTYPALFENVISVGSIDFENNFQDYSYQSSNLTIACPGSNIISYWIRGDTHIDSGTSQSTAICSGIIALLVSKLKKRGELSIQTKITDALLKSPEKTMNGYSYRYINPLQLYKTI